MKDVYCRIKMQNQNVESINEDGYIYKNQKCTLNEIFDDINEWDEIHFTVKNASEDDVLALQNMAKERDIKIVETS